MKKARRVPRKIGGDENGEGDAPMQDDVQDTDLPSIVVKRPASSLRTKKNNSSSTHFNRTSFREDDNEDDANGEHIVVKPTKKASSLHRNAVQRNTARYRISTDRLPDRSSGDEERPSYSSAYLDELRNSTPSGPVKSQSPALDDLDIESKFGSTAPTNTTTVVTSTSSTRIPTAAEIREKKERRRRLAQEANAEEYISLNDRSEASSEDEDDEDPRSRSLIIPADEINIRPKYEPGRLVHDDEDIAEGFDEFVDDPGRVTLSRSARKDQERDRRQQIERQIREASANGSADEEDDAEDDDDDEVDDDDRGGKYKRKGAYHDDYDEDAEQRHAYDASQARAGMYALGGSRSSSGRNRERADREAQQQRLMQPPKVRPIPDLKVLAARYTQAVKEKELARANAERRLEQLRIERQDVEAEEVRIKELLKEAGEKLEKLTASSNSTSNNGSEAAPPPQQEHRGLESLGSLSGAAAVTAAPSSDPPPSIMHVPPWPLRRGGDSSSGSDNDNNNNNINENNGDAFPHQRRGFAGMSGVPAREDDDEDDYY